MKTSNMTSVFSHVMRSGGVLLYGGTIYKNIQTTAPIHYEYFPTDQARQVETTHFPAGAIFVVLTRHNFEKIMYWYVLWALENPGDIKPVRGTCNVTVTDRSSCHRYDQTCINTLLSNLHNFNQSVYGLPRSEVPFYFERSDAVLASNVSHTLLMGTTTNYTRASVANK